MIIIIECSKRNNWLWLGTTKKVIHLSKLNQELLYPLAWTIFHSHHDWPWLYCCKCNTKKSNDPKTVTFKYLSDSGFTSEENNDKAVSALDGVTWNVQSCGCIHHPTKSKWERWLSKHDSTSLNQTCSQLLWCWEWRMHQLPVNIIKRKLKSNTKQKMKKMMKQNNMKKYIEKYVKV